MKVLSTNVDTKKYTCYVYVRGHQTPDGGTLPADLIVSTIRTDIVTMDKNKKHLDIYDLTCPGQETIEIAQRLKGKSIKTQMVSIQPFQVGSRTGNIDSRNHNRDNSAYSVPTPQKQFFFQILVLLRRKVGICFLGYMGVSRKNWRS